MLIHHTIEYDFDLDLLIFNRRQLTRLKENGLYLYIKCILFGVFVCYRKNHVQLSFDVLTNEACVSSVVNHLICQDIMIFPEGGNGVKAVLNAYWEPLNLWRFDVSSV